MEAWRDKIAKVSYPGWSPEKANFAILAVVDPVWTVTTPSGIEIFESQVHGSLYCTPGGLRNCGSDLQAGVEIYHWRYLQFWLILGSQNDPLLGPQFHPPRVVN